jgi:hypothetical protein
VSDQVSEEPDAVPSLAADPVKAAVEVTPAEPESTSVPEPAPAVPEPRPAIPEPTPAVPEATPAAPESVPAVPEPTSAVPEPTSVGESLSIGKSISLADSKPAGDPDSIQLRMRRAPRYRAFGLTGAGLGVLAGVILALSFSATSDYSIRTIVGYFAAILGLIGGLVGLAIAVLIERRRT